MKKIILSLFIGLMSLNANAGLILIDVSNWTEEAGPSNSRNTGDWIGVHRDEPEKKGNSSGALVSDFSLTGDFNFTGFVTPTSTHYDDNDIIGLVFGWQDELNHYRLGWTQTQRENSEDDRSYRDITGRGGLFLIQEKDGLSNKLFNIEDWYWEDDAKYAFDISRQNQWLSLRFGEKEFTVENDQFMSGHIGVYTESQTAKFEQLSADGIIKIPEPTSLTIFALALIGLIVRNNYRRIKSY